MTHLNRRDLLRLIPTAAAGVGFAFTEVEAQQAHEHAQAARQAARTTGSAFKPRFFTPHEFETVKILCDLIIPKDERSGSATDAGVPEFMDFILIDQPSRQVPMRGGLAWIDLESHRRFDRSFAAATEAERRQIMDDISGLQPATPGLTHGQVFFRSFRDLTASGFWTSKMGIEDLGYIGNTFVAEWNGCPAEVLAKLGVQGD